MKRRDAFIYVPVNSRLHACGGERAQRAGGAGGEREHLVFILGDVITGGPHLFADERRRKGLAHQTHFPCREFGIEARVNGRPVRAEAALKAGLSYGSAWQTWRMAVGPAEQPRPFATFVTVVATTGVKVACRAYFIPHDR